MNLQLEVRLMLLKAEIEDLIPSLRYRLAVSTPKHRAALEKAENFAGDFATYLSDPSVVDQLGLDSLQKGVFKAALEDAYAGEIYYHKPQTGFSGFPYLTLPLNNYSDFGYLKKRLIFMAQSHNVRSGMPRSASVMGIDIDSEKTSEPVFFLFSPTPITADNITDIVPKRQLKDTTLSVTRNRVIFETVDYKRGTEETLQYHLLGEMDRQAEPGLLVYAFNRRNARIRQFQTLSDAEFSLT